MGESCKLKLQGKQCPCLYLLACSLWVFPPPAMGQPEVGPSNLLSTDNPQQGIWDPGSKRLSSKDQELPLALHACSLLTLFCPMVSTTDSSSCAVRPCQQLLPITCQPLQRAGSLTIHFHGDLGLIQPKLTSRARSKGSSRSYFHMCLSGKQACLTSILVLHQP